MSVKVKNLIYIDTLEAYKLVKNDFLSHRDILITDNSLLANNPITQNNIKDISLLLSQDKIQSIGDQVLDFCVELEALTLKNINKDKFPHDINKLGLFMNFRGLLLSTIYK